MLSNAYFLAKFHFDTAENEPAKSLQNFANFPNFAKTNQAAELRAAAEAAQGSLAGDLSDARAQVLLPLLSNLPISGGIESDERRG